ncbi:tetratricopeptide repeat protein [Nonomuraea sp. NPDC050536]|uniref:tetratricopeptide repeat protein n=1 Tax=Nonomuraea sp. NPDC050536 TaxID=3364366 RepID=UPI0037CA8501
MAPHRSATRRRHPAAKTARGVAYVIAAAVLTISLGVATNQVLNGDDFQPLWLVLGLVLAVLTIALQRWLYRRDLADAELQPVLWPELTGGSGRPKELSEITPRDLGVHVNRFAVSGQPPYIARVADDLLAAAFTGDDGPRLVIVHGPRLAGATATLAHAVLTHLPGHYRVVAYHDDPRLSISAMIEHAARHRADRGGVVLWLDGLTPQRLAELAAIAVDQLTPGLWVAVTLADGGPQVEPLSGRPAKFLDENAVRVELRTITPIERRALESCDAYAALRPVLAEGHDVLMGRLMVAWEEIRRALAGDGERSTDRIALLRAVTDWYRLHLDSRRLLTRDILDHLFQTYRREIAALPSDAPVPVTGYRSALKWAMTADSSRPRLIDLKASRSGRFYAPHPLLTVFAEDLSEPARWPVHDALWAYADEYFDGEQRRDIGYAALQRQAYPAAFSLLNHTDTDIEADVWGRTASQLQNAGDFDEARRWWKKAIALGHPDHAPYAMYELGLMEKRQDNFEQARHWYGEAIASGHPDHASRAKGSLGLMEKQQGNLDEARHWFGRAIATGHGDYAPWAMIHLGLLLHEQNEIAAARLWYTETIASGHPDHAPNAMHDLGLLEKQQGHVDEARRWYQEAIAYGHPDEAPVAMNGLAELEVEQGDLDEARRCYREVIASGHPEAAPMALRGLAWLARDLGDLDEARDLYGQAIASGHPNEAPAAMRNLGWLEQQQENMDEARRWYHQAFASGHADHAPAAQHSLGWVEELQGNMEEARRWYREAIASGHPNEAPAAMRTLAWLEDHQWGNTEQARQWYSKAITSGHRNQAPAAMRNLGELEARQGNAEQARRWFQEVIASGHPDEAPGAKHNLGWLEERQGNKDEARRWYREAIASGHPETESLARRALRELERREKDLRRAEHYSQYGYLAYADPSMMRPSPAPKPEGHPSEQDPSPPQ